MILDEANIDVKGRPLPRTPEQGVADMLARLQFLNSQIPQIEAQLKLKKADAEFQASASQTLAGLKQDVHEANDRLREYQTQLKGRN